MGPALGIAFLRKGQEPTGSWIIVDRPDFHGNRIQNYQVKVIKADSGFYTGLQVKFEPGVWVVYFGFTAMLVGIGLCFYTTHRRLYGSGSSQILPAVEEQKSSSPEERTSTHLPSSRISVDCVKGCRLPLTKDETQKGGKING